MDPISQGVLGAIAATCCAKKENLRLATLVGWAGGMLADADVLIRSTEDPLLNIEYHRHFTHSLAFIPIGGLVCATLFWPFLRRHCPWPRLWLFATAGYATAGLLDACTSYGTQLLWPFSNARISWSIISIIDPLFTLPLLGLCLAAFFRRRPLYPVIAATFACSYLAFGYLQNQRALEALQQLAAERGHHSITQATVKPSIANLVLWRGIYRYEDRFYVDAIRVAPLSPPRIYAGTATPALEADELAHSLPPDSPLLHDLQRFAHFSDHYLAQSPSDPEILSDLRYAMIPNSLEPLWGIRFDPSKPERHAPFETYRALRPEDRKAFKTMLMGKTE